MNVIGKVKCWEPTSANSDSLVYVGQTLLYNLDDGTTPGSLWCRCMDENQPAKSPAFEQWANDAIVYALFSTASSQSSLRNVQSYGMSKPGNLYNPWFWLSRNQARVAAFEARYDPVLADLAADDQKERYVYERLSTTKLSTDAKEVLDMAISLTLSTFHLRAAADPKFHLHAWDAGWYQIKNGILKTKAPQKALEFTSAFRSFSNRLSEGVYDFGFLPRDSEPKK